MRNKKAVALRYQYQEDKAPVIVAKGRGSIAEKILELAQKYGIPIHEDPELASALMKFDIGEFIPEELYPVVAEVLAFIYTMDKRAAKIFPPTG